MFAEARARAALGDTDGVQKLIDASINLGAQPGWTVGGLMRATGEELIAHGKADAGGETLAQAITWYQTLPPVEKARMLNASAYSSRAQKYLIRLAALRYGRLRLPPHWETRIRPWHSCDGRSRRE